MVAFAGNGGPTPEQKECIETSIRKIVEDNPQLNWWWEEIGKSRDRLIEADKKCQQLPNEEDQKWVNFLKKKKNQIFW